MHDTDQQKADLISKTSSQSKSTRLTESSKEMVQNDCISEETTIFLVYGKEKFSMKVNPDESVVGFKQSIEQLTGKNFTVRKSFVFRLVPFLSGVPPSMQKLIFKNVLRDGMNLRDFNVENGCKIMLIGSKILDVIAANIKPNPLNVKDKGKR